MSSHPFLLANTVDDRACHRNRLVTIAREEGLAALYKGFAPKVLRLAPGGGVLLLVVEFTLGVFRKGTLTSVAAFLCLLTKCYCYRQLSARRTSRAPLWFAMYHLVF